MNNKELEDAVYKKLESVHMDGAGILPSSLSLTAVAKEIIAMVNEAQWDRVDSIIRKSFEEGEQ